MLPSRARLASPGEGGGSGRETASKPSQRARDPRSRRAAPTAREAPRRRGSCRGCSCARDSLERVPTCRRRNGDAMQRAPRSPAPGRGEPLWRARAGAPGRLGGRNGGPGGGARGAGESKGTEGVGGGGEFSSSRCAPSPTGARGARVAAASVEGARWTRPVPPSRRTSQSRTHARLCESRAGSVGGWSPLITAPTPHPRPAVDENVRSTGATNDFAASSRRRRVARQSAPLAARRTRSREKLSPPKSSYIAAKGTDRSTKGIRRKSCPDDKKSSEEKNPAAGARDMLAQGRATAA